MKKQSAQQKKINEAFLKELKAFKRNGYEFNGTGKKLFEGTQREAFDAYLAGLKDGHQEGYYEIPTGVGKTALFIAIIGCYLRATENIPDAPRVLIHEPTVDLVSQTALSFADFMPEIAKTLEADDDQGREIDWKQSEIDIHHATRKGAKNKPRVLITTYQSQAADERKEEESKKVYKREEYHLVIHDEAHYLTGAKFGPAAVDKFKGAIQLGVTATPEYSDNKTVANKLGHRYYHLPLNTAIERGDLCHVRPILIKTTSKTKIDLEKARKFLFNRHGRIFSNEQLEQLLNQEARNQAIAKAYLTGSHPDTGERFLGQTGMIFAGGIQHCNDFVRDTYKALDKPAYREVKNWLRDEGLALIAPIHSAIPAEGVEITIGGKKRICTKNEIKELHRQGKILLIISDQELKLGSDFPRDSFIAETIDRFSVPDATQRMGRGFRVDRPNKRYAYPGNPDKSCAAINVIDETTHEMYKGTAFHPIHTIEILHGAQHRPPKRKSGTISRFKSHPPEVAESLEELGFEFITKEEAIRDVAERFSKGKRKPKTERQLSAEQFAVFTGRSIPTELKMLRSLKSQFDADPDLQEIAECGVQVPRTAVYEISSKGIGNKTLILDNSSGIAERLAQGIKKAAKYRLSAEQFAVLTDRGEPAERALLKSLKSRFDADPDLEIVTEFSIPIPRTAIYEIRDSVGGGLTIDNSDGTADRLAEGIKTTKQSRLNRMQLSALTGRSKNTEWRFLSSLKERFDGDPDLHEITEFGVSIPRKAISQIGGGVVVIDNSEGLADMLANAIKTAKLEKTGDAKPNHAREELKSSPITQKDTKPHGKDLKRTGRGRGKGDD